MDDVEEIKKLKARYFRGLDTKDWDLYAGVFAEDCVVDLRRAGGELYHGREKFAAYARTLTMRSIHHGHMPEIDLTSATTATGVWALEDYNIWDDGTQNHGWGHYLETYEKQGDRWYIKTMALSYLRVERSFGTPPMITEIDQRAHLRGMQPAAN